jgi:DNA-binding IclR family transcriptional regulator
MTDAQARIIEHLRAQQIALTATEIAQAVALPRAVTLDHLRDLEDAGQVRGGESGFYHVANVVRRNRGVA